jgi:hypothetical protein
LGAPLTVCERVTSQAHWHQGVADGDGEGEVDCDGDGLGDADGDGLGDAECDGLGEGGLDGLDELDGEGGSVDEYDDGEGDGRTGDTS